MRIVQTEQYNIEIGELGSSSLNQLLTNNYLESKKVILVDENTHEHCLSALITQFELLSDAEVILLPAGEENKQIEIAIQVWGALTEYEVGRKDLIINLGGGMVSDMGGFIASCYKRGCDFINIPTSLLGMVDASIGGKTGVNLGPFKNQIGVFSNPKLVVIDTQFLSTLPELEVKSGIAEMLKHGLISDKGLFEEVLSLALEQNSLTNDLMEQCLKVKRNIVEQDFDEKGPRKILNFGHTIGHVLEGYFMESNALSHGHAVAIGMMMESYLSMKSEGLSTEEYQFILESLKALYSIPSYSDQDITNMISMLSNDKKNESGKVLCCQLKSIGNCIFDVETSPELFKEVFEEFKIS